MGEGRPAQAGRLPGLALALQRSQTRSTAGLQRFGRITEARAPCLLGGETEAGNKEWACLSHHVH